MAQSGGVSREPGRSIPQKSTFWLLHLGVVGVGAWLAMYDGWGRIGTWFGKEWEFADPVRARILFVFAGVYFLRHGITLFYLLARRVGWGEVFGLVGFMAAFEIGLLLIGGGAFRDQAIALGPLDGLAVILFAVGSWLNTWSEVQRKLWKRDPANKGKCYTGGLFRHAMHINYFGDIVLFTGWSLMTHNPWTLVFPVFMALSFAFMHIPALDDYLAKRYGKEFEAYSRRAKKLIPYIW